MIEGTLQNDNFFGRERELAELHRRALLAGLGQAQSVLIAGPRGIGTSELLKQLFGSLFWRQDRVAPFFHTVSPAFLSAKTFARSYLTRFLCQRLAFEQKEQALLHLGDIPIETLSVIIEEREARWAADILDSFLRSGDDILGMQLAVNAPQRSVHATGIPVAVLIDDFHHLRNLSTGVSGDPRLASLFEPAMSFKKTIHIIGGNTHEILEMPAAGGLDRISLPPLRPDAYASLAGGLLRSRDAGGVTVPPALLRHLGGNPGYLRRLLGGADAGTSSDGQSFWDAYVHGATEGALAAMWSSVLKERFPALDQRRLALAVAHRIAHASGPVSCRQLANAFSLTADEAETTAHKLYQGGLVRGEFGVFRSPDDKVLRDVIDMLYQREILGKPGHDLKQALLAGSSADKGERVRFEITLPVAREAELVAAQCLDQIGKNLQLDQDAVGRLQIAVIEACINAMEHGSGTGTSVGVAIVADRDRLEVSVESEGREFVPREGNEPFENHDGTKTAGRGWGIKLMKRFVDEVRFEKTDRGTRTILIKNLAKATAEKEEVDKRE